MNISLMNQLKYPVLFSSCKWDSHKNATGICKVLPLSFVFTSKRGKTCHQDNIAQTTLLNPNL